jgi:hypothetical protein
MKKQLIIVVAVCLASISSALRAEAYSDRVAEVIDGWSGRQVEVVGWVGSATLVRCNRATGFCLAKSRLGNAQWIVHYTRLKIVVPLDDALPKF